MKRKDKMPKKTLILYLLGIFLINVNFVIAYHGGIGGAASTYSFKTVFLVLGFIAIFILIIWFFRNASKEIGKKKKLK